MLESSASINVLLGLSAPKPSFFVPPITETDNHKQLRAGFYLASKAWY
jgi:hypothetical protein